MAQLNSLLVTGGTKLVGDANANNIITGTETVNNQLYVKYKSGSYLNSLTNSAVVVPDQASSFGGWICGPTAAGRIAISTYQASDNKLYFGYGERGRTTNSYTKQMTWDGPTNTLTADKFVGALQGNADTATTASKLGSSTVGGTTTPIYLNAGTPTALSYTIAKSVPANADFTNTWRPVQDNLTSDSATDSLSAKQGKALANGSARDNTKLPLAGGTLTGRVVYNNVSMPLSAGKVTSLATGTTEIFKDGIAISNPGTANDIGFIRVLGTGESDTVLEIATGDDAGAGEQIVFRQYNTSNVVSREAKIFDTAGNTSFPGKLTVSKAINELLTGTGTTAQDKGSGVSPRYFPAKWTFNKGIATPADGDMITIKIPCAGHDYGVFISLDNGTTYKPVGLKTQDNGRLTTHFGNGKIITLVYDSAAVVDQVFAAAGANSRTNITGAWKVITSYLDGNTDIRAMAYCDTAAGTAAKVASSTNYKLRAKSYVLLNLVNTNSSASALTLNINGQGAKNIYINGSVSSSSNYTLPAGTYLVYYNGTNYYFRTDGSITSETGQGIRAANNNGFVTVNAVPDITGDSVNMNWLTQYENAMGMADLRGTDTTVNPNGKTGWHHFINISYRVTGQASNMWQTQIANAAGTTDLWVRSRNGGTIASGTAWTAPWTRILTGSNYTNVTDGRYLKLAGGTITGSVSCTTSGANLTWGNITIYGGGSDGGKNSMVIGNDAVIGDCNVGGYFGIKPNASGGTNAGIRLFNNAGTMIGGFGSNNGTPKWINASGTEYPIGFYTATATSGQVLVADGTGGGLKTSGYTIAKSVPSDADFKDTKNTAGSTDTSSKIFLIGATSQAANPQTYSDNEVYATSGVLTTKSVQVGGTAATMQYNSTNHCIDFVVT